MKRLLNVTIVITALLSANIVSAKPCPTWNDMLASLDNKLKKGKVSDFLNYFGKGGHKWAALAEFAEGTYSGENIDFMVAVRAYKDDYASFSTTEKRKLADAIITNFVLESGGQQVNLDGKDRIAIENTWRSLGQTGVPAAGLFDQAYTHISLLVENDTFAKYIRNQKEKKVCQ